ncbi:tellurite resistance protein TerC [Povalibacter uvarum]|uniref:Tellurite resistance protein TerC n=1 Tax=Povalibacter uvarum TaxID=732238 RepID=A0A841HSR9_9GAMM|nr:tellurite resistance protein TerC [Povalibacter uvarum]
MTTFLRITYKWARRCAIALVGGTVVLIGILMIVFPGPAIVVIPAGLAILSLEFAWAKDWLRRVKAGGNYMMNSAAGYWSRRKKTDRDV